MRALVDAPVGLLDELGDPFLAAAPSPRVSLSTAAASREATSPACAPPMPSAIAKSGGSHDERVLVAPAPAAGVGRARDRCRASLRRPSGRSGRPGAGRLVASLRARGRRARRSRRCRSSSRGPRPRAPSRAGLEARVARRGEVVAVERDVVLAAAAEGRAAAESTVTRRRRRARGSSTTTSRPRAGPAAARRRAAASARRDDHALLRQSRTSLLALAHDAPDEEVEQDEEGDLEHEKRLVDLDRRCDHVPVRPVDEREDELGARRP